MVERRRTPLQDDPVDPLACTVDERLRILHGLPFFRQLSHADIAGINPYFQAHNYQPGETIYLAGSPASRLYVVAIGRVKLMRHSPSGQDVLLDILTVGELFGSLPALGRTEHTETAQTLTPCCVLGINASDFQTILQTYPPVGLAVLDFVTSRLHGARETISQLSTARAETRIAATLLKLARKVGQETDGAILIQTPLARQDIADMTGTTVETASRVMSQFRRDGLIDSGRQWVSILNAEDLALIAEEDLG